MARASSWFKGFGYLSATVALFVSYVYYLVGPSARSAPADGIVRGGPALPGTIFGLETPIAVILIAFALSVISWSLAVALRPKP